MPKKRRATAKAIRNKSLKRKSSTSKSVKPLRSTNKQLDDSLKSAKYFIKYALDSDARSLMGKIVRRAKQGNDSKRLYSTRGKYIPSRVKIHNVIVRKFLKQDNSKTKPDVYVFGGVAGSGKTSVLARHVKERAMTINNDDIKKALSRYDPSPLRKYPLIHASYLHEESSDIENKILSRAIAGKKDIILDRTLASYVKNKGLLQGMKAKGYKVTVLGTNLPPHIALVRAGARFVKKGRYVPLSIIKAKGNKTNASVLKMAKQDFVSKSRVYNTTKKKAKLMYRKGR
jgi:predicted ABC-type ATPase